MQENPYAKYIQQPQDGPIIGPAKPVDPYKDENQQLKRDAATRSDLEFNYRRNKDAQDRAEAAAKEAKETEEKEAKTQRAKESATFNIRTVLKKIDQIEADARDNGGWFETGTSGALSRAVLPDGTAGADLAKNLQTIDANSAFTALQQMRENSPTGGALGQVTERELDLLKSSIANLDPNQSQDQFLQNLSEARASYRAMLARIEGENEPQADGVAAGRTIGTGITNAPAPNDTPVNPDTRGGVPVGTDVKFGFQGDDGGFDRNKALEGMGLDANAEANIIAFYNANSGKKITAGQLLDFYEENGYPAPPLDELKSAAQKIQQGAKFDPIDTSPERRSYEERIKAQADRAEQTNEAGYGERAQSGTLLGFDDEISGVGSAIGGLVRGDTNVGANYRAGRDVRREINRRADERTGLTGDALEVVSGLAIPLGTVRAPMQAGKQGAKIGAVGGFGYGEGTEGSTVNALIGAGGGAVLGAGGQKLGNALVARSARKADARAENALTAAAAKNQNVDLLPADTGGVTTKRLTSAAAQGPLSAAPIVNAGKRQQEQMGAALARQTGDKLPEDEAGALVKQGADLFIKKTSERGSRLYDRAGEAAKGIKIKPKAAIQTIDENIEALNKLKETNAPFVKELEKLKRDISGGVSVAGLRDARTSLSSGTFDGKLRSGNEKRIYKQILNSLSTDIDAGLRSVGRDSAANMFNRADDFWKQRVEQIDEVLEPIVGKGKSGEDVVAAIQSMATGKRGGVQRLSRLMAELPEEQASAVRSTILDKMGKATKGRQNDAGDVFSASTFLTNWNAMSAKGKAALFRSGDLRKNLDEIARIASSTKEAQRYANHSNTASGIAGQVILTGGAATGGLLPLVLASIAQYGAGKLLSNPAFARWLARAPKTGAPKPYINRLGQIAKAQPAIAGDVKALQELIIKGANDNTYRAAAEDEQ